jgi:hypothetical protein
MSKLQIRCVNRSINKSDQGLRYERIRSIGGFYPNGSLWKFTQEEAILKMEEGSHRFFVLINSKFLNVIVATDRDGRKYLKTETDGEFPIQLLYLYDCE